MKSFFKRFSTVLLSVALICIAAFSISTFINTAWNVYGYLGVYGTKTFAFIGFVLLLMITYYAIIFVIPKSKSDD